MTDLLSDIATPSDAELISSVRGGDVAAYGELFARHKDAANRLARQLVRGPDADDLVSEAFAKVLSVLQNGGGPDVAFRAYLLTAVRRLHVDKMRAAAKVQTSDDMEVFDPGVPFHDTAVASFESGAAARAFASLPERWQLVLWHLEVEGNKPADIAPLLGMSPNSVSALAYRAREGLRQAFLTMHLNDISETECRWVNEHLGAYVRKGLSNRDTTKVQAHLDHCRQCTAMYLELTEVNANLAAIIAPLLLGGAATAYVAASGAAGSAGLVGGLVGRVRDLVGLNGSGGTGGAGGAAGAGGAGAGGVGAGGVGAVAASATAALTTTAGLVTAGVVAVAAAVTAGVVLLPSGDGAHEAALRPQETPSRTVESLPQDPDSTDSTAPDVGDDEQDTDPTGEPTPAAALLPVDGAPDAVETPAVDTPATPVGEPSDDAGPGGPADPTDGPSDPGTPTPVDVTVAQASLEGTDVVVALTGAPALPESVVVRVDSRPAGITFAPTAGCRLGAAARTATCDIPSAPSSGAARGSGRAPTSYTLRLGLDVPPDQPDSDVDIEVDLPAGFEDPRAGDNGVRVRFSRPSPSPVPGPPPTLPPALPPTVPPVLPPTVPPVLPPVLPPVTPPTDPPTDPTDPPEEPTADVALSDLRVDGRVTSAQGTDTFEVSAVLSGVPADRGPVTLTLGGDARFGIPPTDACERLDERSAACTRADGERVQLRVVIDADKTVAAVLTAAPFDDLRDPDPSNNSVSVDLVPTPELQLAVGATTATPAGVGDDGSDSYSVETSVSGTIAAVATTLTLSGPGVTLDGPVPGCSTIAPLTLTCVPNGDLLELQMPVRLAANSDPSDLRVAVTTPPGYVDPTPADDARTVTLVPVPKANLSMVALSAEHAGSSASGHRHVVRVRVDGIPEGLPSVTLSVGPTLTSAEECSVAEGTATCPVTTGPTADFVLHTTTPRDASRTLQVRVGLPDGWTAYGGGTRTGTVELDLRPRIDVDLSGAKVSRDKDTLTYRLTGAVVKGEDRAGMKVRLSLSGTASFRATQPAGCSLEGSNVVCTAGPDGALPATLLTASHPDTATTVRVTAAVVDGVDTDPANDSVQLTLAAVPDIVLESASVTRDGLWRSLDVVVSGVPRGTSVTLALEKQPPLAFFLDASAHDDDGPVICTTAPPRSLSCPDVNGRLTVTTAWLSVGLPFTTTLTVSTPLDEGGRYANNVRSITFD